MLENKRVLIGITGGIAAYKICEVISTLFKAGLEVRVILSDRATQFITPLTVSTLSRHPAYTDDDLWCSNHSRPLHIELGEWADLFVIAPLTANTLGKLACGLADNLLTNTVLASSCPILLVPAMNTEMWEQFAVQQNWQKLQQAPRYHRIDPGTGLLACDRVGTGRMAEPSEIIPTIYSLLYARGKRDLVGKRLLINGGGTREHLDPVRFLGNPSTGKMGLALVRAALYRGAAVTFVHGLIASPLLASLPKAVDCIAVTSAAQMYEAMLKSFSEADWGILSAAVADFRPANYSDRKLPKADIPASLPLTPVADIAAELGRRKQSHQKLIGFAAQTGDIVKPALEKLRKKNLDAIAANPIDVPEAGFNSETNQAIFLDKNGRQEAIASCTKLELAHLLLDFSLQIESF
ncbi:MAG: bifunctional phosphopantothenoylcysteine decarboxylase/phosphopantothenate--cysteine ligase CoaBC [Cyanobacteria bacterium P01_E01_bin.42]